MSIVKIIAGLLFLAVNAKQLFQTDLLSSPGPERQGALFGALLITALAVWLIESGLKKRLGAMKQEHDYKGLLTSCFLKPKQYLEHFAKKMNSSYRLELTFLLGCFFVFKILAGSIALKQGLWLFLVMVVLFAVLAGYWGYFIIGWIYHLLVRLSGGKKDLATSRSIWLFAGLPQYAVVILFTLLGLIFYGSADQFERYISSPLHRLGAFLFVLSALYSIYLGYRGARQLQATNQKRSWIFLIALPALFYVWLLSSQY